MTSASKGSCLNCIFSFCFIASFIHISLIHNTHIHVSSSHLATKLHPVALFSSWSYLLSWSLCIPAHSALAIIVSLSITTIHFLILLLASTFSQIPCCMSCTFYGCCVDRLPHLLMCSPICAMNYLLIHHHRMSNPFHTLSSCLYAEMTSSYNWHCLTHPRRNIQQ